MHEYRPEVSSLTQRNMNGQVLAYKEPAITVCTDKRNTFSPARNTFPIQIVILHAYQVVITGFIFLDLILTFCPQSVVLKLSSPFSGSGQGGGAGERERCPGGQPVPHT